MKTPEEMAEEYRKAWGDEQLYKIRHEHKRFEWGDALVDGFLAGYQAAQQWISVKERLPEDGVGWTMVYGCILSRWWVQPGFYDKDTNEWISRFIGGDEDKEGYAPFENVTHWQPIPEAPKEDK